jgi:two-component system, response regulator
MEEQKNCDSLFGDLLSMNPRSNSRNSKTKYMDYNNVEILLVEDNDYDAMLICRTLRKFNMANNLVHLKDGAEALEFIFASGKYEETRDMDFPPKLIILDIGLPKISGLQVLQRIKNSLPTKAIPLIILTNSDDEADVQKCYNLGANSYVVKPDTYEKFSEAIKCLCHYWTLVNHPPTLRQLYLL